MSVHCLSQIMTAVTLLTVTDYDSCDSFESGGKNKMTSWHTLWLHTYDSPFYSWSPWSVLISGRRLKSLLSIALTISDPTSHQKAKRLNKWYQNNCLHSKMFSPQLKHFGDWVSTLSCGNRGTLYHLVNSRLGLWKITKRQYLPIVRLRIG